MLAIVYKVCYAPTLATKHFEDEISYPILMMMAFALGTLVLWIVALITRKKIPFFMRLLISLLIWSAVLLFIGMTTECPICNNQL